MTDVKARLHEAASHLHDKAVVFAAEGKPIVACLSPESAKMLARWLRTEARCLEGDETHGVCHPEDCTALAALELADHILKEKEQ